MSKVIAARAVRCEILAWKIKPQTLGRGRGAERHVADRVVTRRSGGRKQKSTAKIKTSIGACGSVAVKRGDGAEGGITVHFRYNEQLPIRRTNRFADRMMKQEGAILQTHHLLRQWASQIASPIPAEPLDEKKCPIAKKEKFRWKKWFARRERSKTKHDL